MQPDNVALFGGGRAVIHYTNTLKEVGAVRLQDLQDFRTQLDSLMGTAPLKPFLIENLYWGLSPSNQIVQLVFFVQIPTAGANNIYRLNGDTEHLLNQLRRSNRGSVRDPAT